MTGRRPWLKWYPADWRAEPTLRMCSRAARSLWLDMLGLMHDGEPYGHLTVAGIIPTPKQLASLLGDTERETLRLLAELEAAGVFSRDNAGRIFCRRMLRDKAREDRDRENGKGGGNPSLKGAVASPVKAEGNPGVNPPDKAHMPEARSQKPEKKDTPPPSGSAPSAEQPVRGGDSPEVVDLTKNGGDPLDLPDFLRRRKLGEGEEPQAQNPQSSAGNGEDVHGGDEDDSPPVVARSPKRGTSSPAEVGIPTARRGTRLPADWTLSPELRAWAVAEGHQDPDREAAQFADYWHAKAGRDATKLDWDATWRGWVRRTLDGGRNGQRGRDKGRFGNPFLAALADGAGPDRGA